MRPAALRAAPLVCLLLATSCASSGGVSWMHVGEGGSYLRRVDGDLELRWREDGVETRVEIEGEAVVSDDGRDVVGFLGVGSLRVRTRDAGPRRDLLVESSDDGAARRYSIDGEERAWGAEDAGWFALVLEELEQRVGLGAAARAERLLAEGGPMALARELARVDPGAGQDAMLARLLEEPELEGEVLQVALAVAPRTSSESKRCELAARCAPLQPGDAALTAQLLDVAESLSSSSLRAELIGAIAERRALDASARERAVRIAAATPSESARAMALVALLPAAADPRSERSWVAGAATIAGSSRRADVLGAFLARAAISPEGWTAAVDAVRGIPSESARAEMLAVCARRAPAGAELRTAWLAAVSTISSSSSRSTALSALLERDELDADTWIDAARVAAGTPSESARSELLVRMAREAPPEASSAVLDGVATISSSSSRSAPLLALLEREDLDRAALDQAASVTAGIPSHSIRSQVQEVLIRRLTSEGR